MHRFKLVGLALLAVLAFAAVTASAAMAEEPLILVLTEEKAEELKFTGNSAETPKPTLETLGKKTITCTKASATASFKAVTGKPADSEKGTATIDFEGCKQGGVGCRSETEAGVKDPIETILTPLDLTGASGKQGAALVMMLVSTLNPKLLLNCGVVKDEIKGSVLCVVTPALKEVLTTEKVTITCSQKEGDPEALTCELSAATCKKVKEEPLLANLGTKVFEDSAELITLAGSFNKMVFLDD